MLPLALALLLTVAPGDPTPCTREAPPGKSFATCFEPGDGLVVGAGGLVRNGQGLPSLQAEWRIRAGHSSHSKGTPWFFNHRLLATEAWDGAHEGLSFTLYDGTLRRHLEEGFILVPTSRPVRIPFPFDVTMALRAARFERRAWEGPGWTLETGRVGLLLDPVRSESGRAWLGIGPSASHTLWHSPEGTTYALSPFTTLMLDAGWESDDGLWAVRATGLAGWNLDFEGGTSLFRARAEGSLERVLLSVNDQPVALRLSGTCAHRDAGLARRDEWTVGAGLMVRAFSARSR